MPNEGCDSEPDGVDGILDTIDDTGHNRDITSVTDESQIHNSSPQLHTSEGEVDTTICDKCADGPADALWPKGPSKLITLSAVYYEGTSGVADNGRDYAV